MIPRVPIHPGEILEHEYLLPMDMSAAALARSLGVPANRITDIVRGRRHISADTAIRLGRRLNTSAQFWINLQSLHDLAKAQAENDYSGIKALT
jgi:addiction module HigA family antidote